MTREMVDGENWIIGSPPTSPSTNVPPGPMVQPIVQPIVQSSVSYLSSSTDQLARRDDTSSPAMPEISNRMRPSSAGSHSS